MDVDAPILRAACWVEKNSEFTKAAFLGLEAPPWREAIAAAAAEVARVQLVVAVAIVNIKRIANPNILKRIVKQGNF